MFIPAEIDPDEDNASSGSCDRPVVEGAGLRWNEEKFYNLSGNEGSPSLGIDDVSTPELARLNAASGSRTESPDLTNSGGKNYMKTPQIDGLLVSRGEGRYEKLIRCDTCGKVCRTSNMARHKRRYCTGVPGLSPRRRGRPWVKGDEQADGMGTDENMGYEIKVETDETDGGIDDSRKNNLNTDNIKIEPVSNDEELGQSSS